MMQAQAPWTALEFEARLRRLEAGYHTHHSFNRRLNGGQLQPFQLRGWVANRYYYQRCLPLKDAAILSRCDDRSVRRQWIQRILDHDGHGGEPGGLEAWTQLGVAVGLSRNALESQRHVLPGVRFAVDAYLNFARSVPWQEAAISSLTEMFAPRIHADRLAAWPAHYPWIEPWGLAYFRERITLAERDVQHGLSVAHAWCSTRERQDRALDILQFKLDILWSMLDAIEHAYPDDLAQELRP